MHLKLVLIWIFDDWLKIDIMLHVDINDFTKVKLISWYLIGSDVDVSKQVVLNRPMSEVARRIVSHVRLALLSAEELEKAERDNKKDNLIPVS